MKTICFLAALAATSTSCMRSTTFKCDQDSECAGAGSDPRCTGGFCTFADSSCTVAGRRYADSSGATSGQCVGEGEDRPGGNEPVPMDMMGGEPPMSNCPATGYDTLPNSGPRGHKYKKLAANGTWNVQRDACAADGTYLAFPDGSSLANAQLELAALRTLAGDGAWVGVNDITTEGAYRTSLNLPVSAITQMLIQTSGNPNGTDCLVINNTTLDDANCGDSKAAVCECVP